MAEEGESVAGADRDEGASWIDAGAIRGFFAAGGAFAVGHRDDFSIAVWAGFDVHYGDAARAFYKYRLRSECF